MTPRDQYNKRYVGHIPGTRPPSYLFTSVASDIGAERNKHLLIVDDDPFFRSLVKVMLAQTGLPIARICEAEESETALSLCREHPFDMVLCDLHLPALVSMDGIQIVQEIRKIRPEMPVYMVTADSEENVVRDVVSTGANGYILKPLNLRILKKILLKHFGLIRVIDLPLLRI